MHPGNVSPLVVWLGSRYPWLYWVLGLYVVWSGLLIIRMLRIARRVGRAVAGVQDQLADLAVELEKLEAMTSVCSVGLDMVAVPGDTPPETLAAIIADEMAIGVTNHKTTAVRIIPVPGKEAGDYVAFGGLFGESAILPVRNAGASSRFTAFGGKIPAPIHSLKN